MNDDFVDEDTQMYHEYLNALKAHWSSGVAAKMLNDAVMSKVVDRFSQCATSKKVRILTSFLYLPEASRKRYKDDLRRVALQAETDRDDWLKKLAKFVVPYVTTGKINLKDIDSEVASHVIRFLDAHSKETPDVQYYQRTSIEWPHVWDNSEDDVKQLTLDELLGLARVSKLYDPEISAFKPNPNPIDGVVSHILQEGVRQLKIVKVKSSDRK
ncbi:MAG: hypothetical protein KVP17_002793 [Porospora cf. gigantea B]|uniref:uncharacterized protein n=1 Tax=Porospora cf. gigantea A TaxID=2853593 RepID=UPI00355A0E17|nr:MAG: hypothetical protein KVP17_002793 [Porospora cf. gigantea B]KAH0487024.1 MAG: hypothetical protein KVP18_003778 [Porospora cf. gigantea A]